MIRVLTFFIIILIVYGFHIHYKNKESFESGSNIIILANNLGINKHFLKGIHNYGETTKERGFEFKGCATGFELKQNIDYNNFNFWDCGKGCPGQQTSVIKTAGWTDIHCNCICVNSQFIEDLKYWETL
jgi:hypothetical protein